MEAAASCVAARVVHHTARALYRLKQDKTGTTNEFLVNDAGPTLYVEFPEPAIIDSLRLEVTGPGFLLQLPLLPQENQILFRKQLDLAQLGKWPIISGQEMTDLRLKVGVIFRLASSSHYDVSPPFCSSPSLICLSMTTFRLSPASRSPFGCVENSASDPPDQQPNEGGQPRGPRSPARTSSRGGKI